MAKKKLRDCTYEEIIRMCENKPEGKAGCDECPLNVCIDIASMPLNVCDVSPLQVKILAPKALDIEVDIPEEEEE